MKSRGSWNLFNRRCFLIPELLLSRNRLYNYLMNTKSGLIDEIVNFLFFNSRSRAKILNLKKINISKKSLCTKSNLHINLRPIFSLCLWISLRQPDYYFPKEGIKKNCFWISYRKYHVQHVQSSSFSRKGKNKNSLFFEQEESINFNPLISSF